MGARKNSGCSATPHSRAVRVPLKLALQMAAGILIALVILWMVSIVIGGAALQALAAFSFVTVPARSSSRLRWTSAE